MSADYEKDLANVEKEFFDILLNRLIQTASAVYGVYKEAQDEIGATSLESSRDFLFEAGKEKQALQNCLEGLAPHVGRIELSKIEEAVTRSANLTLYAMLASIASSEAQFDQLR